MNSFIEILPNSAISLHNLPERILQNPAPETRSYDVSPVPPDFTHSRLSKPE